MDALKTGQDVLFILLGGIMVLAMHSGFAFLELGTVRKKNQVNALVKILVDFSVSTIAYFFVGFTIAYGHAEQIPRSALTGDCFPASGNEMSQEARNLRAFASPGGFPPLFSALRTHLGRAAPTSAAWRCTNWPGQRGRTDWRCSWPTHGSGPSSDQSGS